MKNVNRFVWCVAAALLLVIFVRDGFEAVENMTGTILLVVATVSAAFVGSWSA